MQGLSEHTLQRRGRCARGRARVSVFLAVTATMVMAVGGTAAVPARAASDSRFHRTDLVTDDAMLVPDAKLVDPSLKNPWGLALGPSTPL